MAYKKSKYEIWREKKNKSLLEGFSNYSKNDFDTYCERRYASSKKTCNPKVKRKKNNDFPSMMGGFKW